MKLSITVDVNKLDKARIEARTFTNKEGQEVTAKDLKLDAIPLNRPQQITEGDTWALVKTHFVVQSPTKEERANKIDMPIVGDGMQFRDKGQTAPSEPTQAPQSNVNVEDEWNSELF